MNEENKSTLSPEDLEKIQDAKKYNPVVRFLANQDSMRFNVGDILIVQHTRYQHDDNSEVKVTWHTENVSDVSKTPKKFMYVYEDEFGVGYLKRLKASGKGLGESLICMADINPDSQRYIVDPDYQDHVLIGEGDFNYNQAFKEQQKRRNQITKQNKKLVENLGSHAKVNELLKKLKPGDKIWLGGDIYRATKNENTVLEVKMAKVDSISWEARRLDGTTNVVAELKLSRNNYTYNTIDLAHMVIMLKPPTPYEDQL